MKLPLMTLAFALLFSQNSFAELKAYGLQCNGVESQELKSCLKKEADKIDEANLPNEIIISSDSAGKNALVKIIRTFTENRTDEYAKKLQNLIPLVESAVATALIIQYEDEPQLYYYVIDKNGKLEVVIDGMNSVDISMNNSELLKNAPETFYLNSKLVSATFLEWLDFLKEN